MVTLWRQSNEVATLRKEVHLSQVEKFTNDLSATKLFLHKSGHLAMFSQKTRVVRSLQSNLNENVNAENQEPQ